MAHSPFAAVAAALAATAGAPAVQAQSAKLETNQVPPHIAVAARAAGGFEQISEAGIEVEGARLIFGIKGRVRELDILASGEVEEIEDEIQQGEVPQPVTQAVQRWMPTFKPTKIERSERPVPGCNGATFLAYEFEGQHGGMELDVEVVVDGSRLMIVDDAKG